MKTILFDFFGVISTPVYMKVIKKYIPEEDQQFFVQKLDVLDTGDLSEEDLVQEIAIKAGITTDEVWDEVKRAPVVNEELLNFIQNELKPKYRVGLLTNIPRSLLVRIIPDKLELFDPLMISSDLKLIKPSKEIFEVAIARCECLPSEILFTDDGEKNIAAAKSVGLHGIVYTDFLSFKEELKKYI